MADGKRKLDQWLGRIAQAPTLVVRGRVTEASGLCVKAVLPEAQIGQQVEIQPSSGPPITGEVVAFNEGRVVIMPYAGLTGIGPTSQVTALGPRLLVGCSLGLAGCVLNGLGQLIDGSLGGQDVEWRSIDAVPPDPLARQSIRRPFPVGLRAVDGLLTLGEGQRIGLFAGPGVGKSSLLNQIARQACADLSVVCLVGERGREIRSFIDQLDPASRQRTVVVCAPANASPLERITCAQVAMTVAEFFRDHDRHVLLLLDSLTRYARALREVGLAAGEPPARQGYPPSVFRKLPLLLERAGCGARGAISAILTILVPGNDMTDPIADDVSAILDGHIVLSPKLAQRNHWPAIDPLASVSRVANELIDADHARAAGELRELLAAYETQREMIALGVYKRGSDRLTDRAIARLDAIASFLRQRPDERSDLAETRAQLLAAVADG